MTTDNQLPRQKHLHDYYTEELKALRVQAEGFAKLHPDMAPELGLPPAQKRDPHVERTLEGVAFLAGRIRARIDDDFPELTQALFGVLYPHLLNPIPPMAVVQLNPRDPSNDTVTRVPRHDIKLTATVSGVECSFRNGYPVELWPVEVVEATVPPPPPFGLPLSEYAPNPDPKKDGWAAKAALVLRLRTTGAVPFHELQFPRPAPPADGLPPWPVTPPPPTALRLFLSAGAETGALYEHLFNDVGRVVFRNPHTRKVWRADANRRTRTHECLRPVGFAPHEALLPYPPQAFAGYRVLAEYFAYREKFHFVDLCGWDEARRAGVLEGKDVEVLIYFDREVSPTLRRELSAATFRPRCVPVVNLFEHTAEVFPLDERRYEYPVVPAQGQRDSFEVYSIEDVVVQDRNTGARKTYDPFYTFRHGTGTSQAYWYARRRPSARTMIVAGAERQDFGTEVDLCFTDLDFDPHSPAAGRVMIRALCLNRDVPGRPRGDGGGEVQFKSDGNYGAVAVVRPPTPTRRPPSRTGAYWRLVSHLSLNHLSITAGGGEGRDALREYLRLYDFTDRNADEESDTASQQVVQGLERVDSRPAVEFVRSGGAAGFARGVEIDIHLDADKFETTGAYLFAAVLDEFFRLYVSVNSFTRLKFLTTQRGPGDPVKRFPARTGTRPIL